MSFRGRPALQNIVTRSSCAVKVAVRTSGASCQPRVQRMETEDFSPFLNTRRLGFAWQQRNSKRRIGRTEQEVMLPSSDLTTRSFSHLRAELSLLTEHNFVADLHV